MRPKRVIWSVFWLGLSMAVAGCLHLGEGEWGNGDLDIQEVSLTGAIGDVVGLGPAVHSYTGEAGSDWLSLELRSEGVAGVSSLQIDIDGAAPVMNRGDTVVLYDSNQRLREPNTDVSVVGRSGVSFGDWRFERQADGLRVTVTRDTQELDLYHVNVTVLFQYQELGKVTDSEVVSSFTFRGGVGGCAADSSDPGASYRQGTLN